MRAGILVWGSMYYLTEAFGFRNEGFVFRNESFGYGNMASGYGFNSYLCRYKIPI